MQTSFWDMNPSEPSSGTPTAAECSESEPQRDGSPTCGCMKEMSGCSIHPNTRDEWILSQRDSLASLLASPEIARGRVTKENCSERSFAAWMSSDPNMSFSKMCLDFSRHDPALAYAAGLIDGEGSISIQSRYGEQYSIEVAIGMTIKAIGVLEQMKARFGGTICKMRGQTDKWESAKKWRIGGEDAANFLIQILPYLMLKQKQALTAIQLDTMRREIGWNQKSLKQAQILKLKINELNKKGPLAQNAGAGWYEDPDLFHTWAQFSGTWPRAGMMRDGRVYRHRQPVPRTTVIGGGALQNVPTPTVNGNYNRKGASQNSGDGLATYVKMWPTPVADDACNRKEGKWNSRGEPKLSAQVKMWPTPQTRGYTNDGDLAALARMCANYEEMKGMAYGASDKKKRSFWPTPCASAAKGSSPASLTRTDGRSRSNDRLDHAVMGLDGGQLSPDWTEWLMGFPIGHTASKLSATPKSRSKPRLRGNS